MTEITSHIDADIDLERQPILNKPSFLSDDEMRNFIINNDFIPEDTSVFWKEYYVNVRKIRIEKTKKIIEGKYSEQDFSLIKDDYIRKTFIDLCNGWENAANILSYEKKKKKISEQRPVNCNRWMRWVTDIKKYADYEPIKERIDYNDRHYAVWGIDPIFILDDYYIRANDWTIVKYSSSFFYANFGNDKKWNKRHEKSDSYSAMSAKDIAINYINLCKDLFKGVNDFDKLLWQCMYVIVNGVDVETYLDNSEKEINNHNVLSPKLIYNWLIFCLGINSYKKPKLYKKTRHKKVYLEPGFEDVAKLNYKEDKGKGRFKQVFNAMRAVLADNEEMTYNNILKKGYIKCSLKVLKVVLKKMMEDPQYKVYLSEERFKIKKEKKIKNGKEWHLLVEEGYSYKEILKDFPDLKYGAYKVYRRRLKEG